MLYSVGGSFRRDARSLIGPLAVEGIRRFHLDRAFLGTSGLTKDGVFSAQNAIESELKRAAIAQAARAIVLTDASKIGQAAFSIFARPDDVRMLVTNEAVETRELQNNVPFEVVVADAAQSVGVHPADESREERE